MWPMVLELQFWKQSMLWVTQLEHSATLSQEEKSMHMLEMGLAEALKWVMNSHPAASSHSRRHSATEETCIMMSIILFSSF